MKRLSVMRLALGYAGMFFGAGFVSGQEIRQFFVVYGTAGLFGLVLSALLFFAVGILFFETARQSPEQTVGELLVPGYHPLLSGAVDLAEDVLLFGVVVIMTAGAGAMVQQVTGWPAAAAGAVFVLVIFAASLKNMRSVMTVFSVLAPCLTVCAVAVAAFVLLRYGSGAGAAGAGTSAAATETAEAAVAKTLESEKRAKEKGYSGDRWFIIETKWARVFDKNGEFLRENEHSEVVAIVNADGTVEYK